MTVAPSPAQTTASPLIPAPPMPMKWSRRPVQSLIATPLAPRSAASRTWSAIVRAASWLRQAARRGRHLLQPRRVAEDPADLGQQRRRVEGVVFDDLAAPARSIQRAFARWWSAVA